MKTNNYAVIILSNWTGSQEHASFVFLHILFLHTSIQCQETDLACFKLALIAVCSPMQLFTFLSSSNP